VIFCLMRSDNFSLHFTNDYPYEAVQYALYHKVLDANCKGVYAFKVHE
jgi:hypothetical protein